MWYFLGGGRGSKEVKASLSREDSEFWTCREIGREIWDTISVEMQKEAISRQVWADQGAMDTWKKQVGLVGNGIIRMKPQDKRKID